MSSNIGRKWRVYRTSAFFTKCNKSTRVLVRDPCRSRCSPSEEMRRRGDGSEKMNKKKTEKKNEKLNPRRVREKPPSTIKNCFIPREGLAAFAEAFVADDPAPSPRRVRSNYDYTWRAAVVPFPRCTKTLYEYVINRPSLFKSNIAARYCVL